jgi:xanthine dehydrogenase accessory factor
VKNLFLAMKAAVTRQENVVLVSVIGSAGSTPREAGALMLMGEQGRLYGTIGGGIAEYLAEGEAKALIPLRMSRIKTYSLHPGGDTDIGGRCGGEVSAFFQYLDASDGALLDVIDAALRCLAAGADAALTLRLTEDRAAMSFGLTEGESISAWVGRKPSDLRELTAQNGFFSIPLSSEGFVYVFGSGHVAQEVVPLLAHLGFRCGVFDNREQYLRTELFPSAIHLIHGDYLAIASSLRLTEQDYAVIVTSSHEYDFRSIAFALGTPARYIGMIGSRSKLSFVKGRLGDLGFSEAQIEAPRVHTPIGLSIKSKTPAEVAVSIAAELILTRAEQ